MAGIVSYGAYIPYSRLPRAEVGSFWGRRAAPGEKAVANYDEDAITIAVEAARNCLRDVDRSKVDGLFFASTSSPFKEKQASSLIAAALHLPKEIPTADFSNSLRGGTIALQLTLNTIKAKMAKNILVIASDCRRAFPGSALENDFGDGACACLVGDSGVLATIDDSYVHYDEIIDKWRGENDRFVQYWEDRYVLTAGYTPNITKAMSNMLKKGNSSPGDFAKVALFGPDRRNMLGAIGGAGFDAKTQFDTSLIDNVGNTGAASAFISLAAALDEAKPGDRILLANYGGGADAFILKVTDEIEKGRSNKRGIKNYLEVKRTIPYSKYLRFHELIEMEVGRDRPPHLSSPPVLWRAVKNSLPLIGHKCRHCGKIQYPAERVCMSCGSKDDFDDYPFADREGTLFTFSIDDMAPSPDPPTLHSITDVDGGGRLSCLMTDCDPQEVKIGMRIKMSFRKLSVTYSYPNYWWKSTLVR